MECGLPLHVLKTLESPQGFGKELTLNRSSRENKQASSLVTLVPASVPHPQKCPGDAELFRDQPNAVKRWSLEVRIIVPH